MTLQIPTIDDVRRAEPVIRGHVSEVPVLRSWPLERLLGLPESRRVWLLDYGWTPVRSFKLFGALKWMDAHRDELKDRAVVAHSSGNFACGIAFAGMRYGGRVMIVMPDDAPAVKFEMVRELGAEVFTYDKSRDHETGDRDRLTRELAEEHNALQASPYDDFHVIAGNGVGALDAVRYLKAHGRSVSRFLCQVSGGGLMAGHALVMAAEYPQCQVIGVEPAGADDFRQSLMAGQRVRIDRPESICDGLLSYDVGMHNWPILQRSVHACRAVADDETCAAMKWLYDQHGLRAEPSGAIATAAVLQPDFDAGDEGDLLIVISGRNADETQFRNCISN